MAHPDHTELMHENAALAFDLRELAAEIERFQAEAARRKRQGDRPAVPALTSPHIEDAFRGSLSGCQIAR